MMASGILILWVFIGTARILSIQFILLLCLKSIFTVRFTIVHCTVSKEMVDDPDTGHGSVTSPFFFSHYCLKPNLRTKTTQRHRRYPFSAKNLTHRKRDKSPKPQYQHIHLVMIIWENKLLHNLGVQHDQNVPQPISKTITEALLRLHQRLQWLFAIL